MEAALRRRCTGGRDRNMWRPIETAAKLLLGCCWGAMAASRVAVGGLAWRLNGVVLDLVALEDNVLELLGRLLHLGRQEEACRRHLRGTAPTEAQPVADPPQPTREWRSADERCVGGAPAWKRSYVSYDSRA